MVAYIIDIFRHEYFPSKICLIFIFQKSVVVSHNFEKWMIFAYFDKVWKRAASLLFLSNSRHWISVLYLINQTNESSEPRAYNHKLCVTRSEDSWGRYFCSDFKKILTCIILQYLSHYTFVFSSSKFWRFLYYFLTNPNS